MSRSSNSARRRGPGSPLAEIQRNVNTSQVRFEKDNDSNDADDINGRSFVLNRSFRSATGQEPDHNVKMNNSHLHNRSFRSHRSRTSDKNDSFGRQDKKDEENEKVGPCQNFLVNTARRIDQFFACQVGSVLWMITVVFTGVIAVFIFTITLSFTLGVIQDWFEWLFSAESPEDNNPLEWQ